MTTLPNYMVNPRQVHSPQPSYSHVCVAPIGDGVKLVTIAGQIGKHPETGEIPPTFAAQVDLALENVGRCLREVQADIKDIVRVQQFIVNLSSPDSTRVQAYLRFMGDHRPPSTVIGVQALAQKELLYEIEVTALARTSISADPNNDE
ncbi:hypothetical protein LTR54_017807 [Friedmanniomyces endolithicus]|uniref:Enamine deaminase RidA n=1 Tax=Friedmanniomyces endolithicus TaxID=329885 RepID=A0AAN6F3K8_9PEZI|nr:hypothetical protein LTS00_017761 [Friedmanniomyces endolithicus]KAK0302797.1 hypothetical protein LTR82_017761 [Friedmanniomyces endolithicus]KAK0971373.1 hypothetical protein LTR54_017807 [Friedmanniomyces endolithicus]